MPDAYHALPLMPSSPSSFCRAAFSLITTRKRLAARRGARCFEHTCESMPAPPSLLHMFRLHRCAVRKAACSRCRCFSPPRHASTPPPCHAPRRCSSCCRLTSIFGHKRMRRGERDRGGAASCQTSSHMLLESCSHPRQCSDCFTRESHFLCCLFFVAARR